MNEFSEPNPMIRPARPADIPGLLEMIGSVLDWNRHAIDLYERVGGEVLHEWRMVRMNHEGIQSLPEK